MNCEQFESICRRYLEGSLSSAEVEDVESHLLHCAGCRGLMDEEMERRESEDRWSKRMDVSQPARLDEKQQQRILRRAKYKNRFSMALFLVVLFILLNAGGILLSSLYYTVGGENSRLFKVQQTAALLTESTFPNVTVPAKSASPFPAGMTGAGWGHSSVEIKPYFVAQGDYALQKRIGKDDYGIGSLNINQFFSAMNVNWQWQDGSFNDYLYFYHPEQLKDMESPQTRINLINNAQPVWQALAALPEGTVTEMSVSFTRTYSIDEIYTLLNEYDVDITWYAISTGLEADPQYSDDRQAPLTAFHGVWGLPASPRHMAGRSAAPNEPEALSREQYLLESMQFLLDNENTAKRIFRGQPEFLQISQRYEYIKANGISVYGVVVTGPSRELLKLKELDFVHSPGLGEVRLWNWFDRSFKGELY